MLGMGEGGGGGGGGESELPPGLFTCPSSSLRRAALRRLGGIALRNYIEVSQQCESERDTT